MGYSLDLLTHPRPERAAFRRRRRLTKATAQPCCPLPGSSWPSGPFAGELDSGAQGPYVRIQISPWRAFGRVFFLGEPACGGNQLGNHHFWAPRQKKTPPFALVKWFICRQRHPLCSSSSSGVLFAILRSFRGSLPEFPGARTVDGEQLRRPVLLTRRLSCCDSLGPAFKGRWCTSLSGAMSSRKAAGRRTADAPRSYRQSERPRT